MGRSKGNPKLDMCLGMVLLLLAEAVDGLQARVTPWPQLRYRNAGNFADGGGDAG